MHGREGGAEARRPPISFEIRPVGTDVDAAIRLAGQAVRANPWALTQAEEITARIAERIRSGGFLGGLLAEEGRCVGFVSWSRRGTLGLSVELLYLTPGSASAEGYGLALAEVERSVAPLVFVSGPLPGISADEERRTMDHLGLRPFGRSEMVRTGIGAPPAGPLPSGVTLRPVGAADEEALARLHMAAYSGRFDRYLFLETEDEAADARQLVGDLFRGRWGEPSTAGSIGAVVDGELRGAVLSVKRGPGALIADVMVDPAAQGKGIGRAVLAAAVEGLDRAGERPAVLNVTEGNAHAQRLYERLGFVRSLGPSTEWYNPRRVPSPPEEG